MVDWGGDENFARELVSARADLAKANAEIVRLCAELATSQERVRIQAELLAELDHVRAELAKAERELAIAKNDLGFFRDGFVKKQTDIERAHDKLCVTPEECDLVTACGHAISNALESDARAERAEAALAAAERRIAEQSERIAELYRSQKNRILSAKSVEYDIGTLQTALAEAERKGIM